MANDEGAKLGQVTQRPDEEGGLLDTIAEVAMMFAPAGRRVLVPSEEEGQTLSFDVTALACGPRADAAAGHILLLAHDGTLERNLITALSQSRSLFRDFTDCSADFIWETDKTGRFSFVNADGALGFTSDQLRGAMPAILAPREDTPPAHRAEQDIFHTRAGFSGREIWVNDAGGTPVCLRISARAVHDRQGAWIGARGVGQNITELKARSAELATERNRDRLISALAAAVQGEAAPLAMLNAAAQALGEALNAEACWVVPLGAGEPPAGIDMSDPMPGHTSVPPPPLSPGTWQRAPQAKVPLPAGLEKQVRDSRTILALSDPPISYLAQATDHHETLNGLVCVAFNGGATPAAASLLAHAASHVAIALVQANQIAALEFLSRTDELTGLLNRRAFRQELEEGLAALSAHEATQKQGALFYIDLDDFKRLNDTQGHRAGDELLAGLGSLLRHAQARTGAAVRLGGDEFALWLPGCSRVEASLVAERVIGAFSQIAEKVASPRSGLPGLSIGIALYQADHPETADELIHRADQTLYEVKQHTKGRWEMAPDPDCSPDYSKGPL